MGLKNRAVGLAQSTGLPTVLMEAQEGKTFGERLSNAFTQVFESGYDQVIAIGGDCPELTKQDLIDAALQLKIGKAVLGPDHRNGAYLIGLKRQDFEADRFAQLPWQTAHTFEALTNHLKEPYLLSARQDVNNTEDFRLLVRTAVRYLRRMLLSFLKPKDLWPVPVTNKPHGMALQEANLRGPPHLNL